LTATVGTVLAAIVVASLLHEMRPRQLPAEAATPARPQPPALTADEESYAAALWRIQRDVTPAAVAMTYAGIAYQTETHDEQELGRKIAPLAAFFADAQTRVRTLAAPPSLARLKEQYAGAMGVYANAAEEMLRFVRDGNRQHLNEAQRMGVDASETLLRVGEVLWPGQYKPH
jgi:hypothetical protein